MKSVPGNSRADRPFGDIVAADSFLAQQIQAGASQFLQDLLDNSARSWGVIGTFGMGRTALLAHVADRSREHGITPTWWRGADTQFGPDRHSETRLVLVDDADLLNASDAERLAELIGSSEAGAIVTWNPGRIPVAATEEAYPWRHALGRVQQLMSLSQGEVELWCIQAGLPGYGTDLSAWTGGIPALVHYVLMHARSVQADEPAELLRSLLVPATASGLVQLVLTSYWHRPSAVAEVLRLLALVQGDNVASLLQAPFLPHHDLQGSRDAFDELERQGLADSATLTLQPPLLARAVLPAIGPAERSLAERRVATALWERGYSPGVVATHLVHTRPAGIAWERSVLRKAAERALIDHDWDLAIQCLERVCQESVAGSPRHDDLGQLGVLKCRANPSGGLLYLRSALSTGPPRIEWQRALVRCLLAEGDTAAALRQVAQLRTGSSSLSFLIRLLLLGETHGDVLGETFDDGEPAHDTRAPDPLAGVAQFARRLADGRAAYIDPVLGPGLGDTGVSDSLALIGLFRVPVLARAGMVVDAVNLALRTRAEAAGLGMMLEERMACISLCWLHLHGGHLADAATELAHARSIAVPGVSPAWMSWSALTGRALSLLLVDQRDEDFDDDPAPAESQALLSYLRFQVEWAQWRLGRSDTRPEPASIPHWAFTSQAMRAWVDAVSDDIADLQALASSARLAKRLGHRVQRLLVLTDLAMELGRRGQMQEATSVHEQAWKLARRLGATQIERVLSRAQIDTERGQDDLRAVLTKSELRVARMARQGLSNREISHALCLSLRTVETHLTHVYRKLDIRGRSQLRTALAAQP